MKNDLIKQKTKEDFLKALDSEKAVGSISLASLQAGVSRQTIYNWRKEDYNFDQAVVKTAHEAKTRIADLAEQALVKKINDGDITAIIFTLKNLRGNYYGDKEERQKAEERISNPPNSVGHPKTEEEALLLTGMYLWHLKKSTEKGEVLTPKLQEMYDKLEKLIKDYQIMLGYK